MPECDCIRPLHSTLAHTFAASLRKIGRIALLLLAGISATIAESASETPFRIKSVAGVSKNTLLPPGPGNPRNSEGDFITLRDGRVLFVYTHFTGGAGDHSTAHLAGRYSHDGGQTWETDDVIILRNEGGYNIMSVSLLRLSDGSIGLFYMRKNSLEDCRPLLRISRDEAKTWSEPIEIITDEIGYYVLNNDRVIQLADGRLICPVALHNLPSWDEPDWKGLVTCYLSDDSGQSWRRCSSLFKAFAPDGTRVYLQEPGVLELQDGDILLWGRSDGGSQYQSRSSDRGETWSKAIPSNIISPRSPATIERIPGRSDLIMVWNDHSKISPELQLKRTPLAIAISQDDGRTWGPSRILEDDPNGWYCYTALDFVGDRILLGHCAGDNRIGGLNLTQITYFNIDWLYQN